MLAYAANRTVVGKRESSPNALLLVISAHVALLALVMSAKMDFPKRITRTPPLINIRVPIPPPPDMRTKKPQTKDQWIDHPTVSLPIPNPRPQPFVDERKPADPVSIGGGGLASDPQIVLPPITIPIHQDARLLTPASELKPPYPAAKLASEEEAILRLRLAIDERGRVTAVDPVGHADREFLETARRYIIGHWRYEPASEGGQPTSSTILVTLRFKLDS